MRSAEKSPTPLLAAAQTARHRFQVGGAIFGGWVGLVLGWSLFGAALPRQRHDFEPERSASFACARCLASCPQEQVRLGGMGAPHETGLPNEAQPANATLSRSQPSGAAVAT